MTPEQALEKMREIAKYAKHDPEWAHKEGDKLLCSLLVESGYSGVVVAFESMKKWYV